MSKKFYLYSALIAFIIVAPFAFPDFKTQLATVWLMIIVALTWDMTGGQMGYNSLGNITFYGTGMYVAAVVAIALVYEVQSDGPSDSGNCSRRARGASTRH